MLTPWTNQMKQATLLLWKNLPGLVRLDVTLENKLRLFLPVF
jgi:hypothetical protein